MEDAEMGLNEVGNSRLDSFGDELLADLFSQSDNIPTVGTPTVPKPAQPEPSDHESILAEAMSSLTFSEQQTAMNDIHGVSEVATEDPEMINQKLVDMELELSKITSPLNEAYLMAKTLNPTYVYNMDFRLLFLRADYFNAKGAALRFARHFKLKLRLFGPEKLGRANIYMTDLSPADLSACCAGSRWLFQRDRSGRALCLWVPPANGIQHSIESRLRAAFWACMRALQDKETQKRGMVLIMFITKSMRGSLDPQLAMRLPEISNALPTNFVGFHICNDDVKIHPLLSLVISAFDKFLTVRCRSHFGSVEECISSLMTFGIPREVLPITDDGDILIDDLVERGKKRLEQERLPTPTELLVFIPGQFDVLFGRKKSSQDHVGNIRFRNLVVSHLEEYERANKNEKTSIAEEIVKQVKAVGGHFLTDYYADFIEVSDITARKKAAHAFRSQRRIQEGRRKSETSQSNESSPRVGKRTSVSSFLSEISDPDSSAGGEDSLTRAGSKREASQTIGNDESMRSSKRTSFTSISGISDHNSSAGGGGEVPLGRSQRTMEYGEAVTTNAPISSSFQASEHKVEWVPRRLLQETPYQNGIAEKKRIK